MHIYRYILGIEVLSEKIGIDIAYNYIMLS